MKIIPKLPLSLRQRESNEQAIYNKLIADEAKIGGQLFGAVPAGHRREFFCLDEHTWVWHEEWVDSSKQRQSLTTRYDVRPNGVLKSQGNSPYSMVSFEEALNLYQAVSLYEKHVDQHYTARLQRA